MADIDFGDPDFDPEDFVDTLFRDHDESAIFDKLRLISKSRATCVRHLTDIVTENVLSFVQISDVAQTLENGMSELTALCDDLSVPPPLPLHPSLETISVNNVRDEHQPESARERERERERERMRTATGLDMSATSVVDSALSLMGMASARGPVGDDMEDLPLYERWRRKMANEAVSVVPPPEVQALIPEVQGLITRGRLLEAARCTLSVLRECHMQLKDHVRATGYLSLLKEAEDCCDDVVAAASAELEQELSGRYAVLASASTAACTLASAPWAVIERVRAVHPPPPSRDTLQLGERTGDREEGSEWSVGEHDESDEYSSTSSGEGGSSSGDMSRDTGLIGGAVPESDGLKALMELGRLDQAVDVILSVRGQSIARAVKGVSLRM
ncbi:hypothetical protein KIPB_007566 [Kipferlia bialata]|uniref:Uncharacterized protein n=1 Tax=Kipferlia bialata TaxID=797122 RepID=A0A9K3GKS7_9EUKA|nr:hypothetical protein KIPB_007566 [Kipferlia bialata]|eukprot:g7566.t1